MSLYAEDQYFDICCTLVRINWHHNNAFPLSVKRQLFIGPQEFALWWWQFVLAWVQRIAILWPLQISAYWLFLPELRTWFPCNRSSGVMCLNKIRIFIFPPLRSAILLRSRQRDSKTSAVTNTRPVPSQIGFYCVLAELLHDSQNPTSSSDLSCTFLYTLCTHVLPPSVQGWK